MIAYKRHFWLLINIYLPLRFGASNFIGRMRRNKIVGGLGERSSVGAASGREKIAAEAAPVVGDVRSGVL